MKAELKKELSNFAVDIRIGAMEQFKARGFGHVGGVMSIADAIAVLYGAVMDYDPHDPCWDGRDKLVCSKGHAGPALYAALALKGFFDKSYWKSLNQGGTRLPSHCDMNLTPGIDMTTGSLGQGASTAVGLALGEKLRGRHARVFLILGDGELDEGQVWEAAMFASKYRLGNLIVLIDENKKQLDGTTEEIMELGDIVEKFKAFGFDTVRVPGNDIEAVYEAVMAAKSACATGRPHAIVLDTVKGSGIKFVEDMELNHHITISEQQATQAIEELEKMRQ